MVGSPQSPDHANGAAVQPFLLRTDFPVRRDDLATLVEARGAGRRIVETIERLPDLAYGEPGEVLEAIKALDGGASPTLLA